METCIIIIYYYVDPILIYVTPLPFSPVQFQYDWYYTKETIRSSHSDTKKLDHFTTCNIISANLGNKRRNLMQIRIFYSEVYLPLHMYRQSYMFSYFTKSLFSLSPFWSHYEYLGGAISESSQYC